MAAGAVAVATAPAIGAKSGPALVDPYVLTQRLTYGLPVDPETLATVAWPGVDVGTAKWGFPLSPEEDLRLDLNGRMRFADQVSLRALPFARGLGNYAGAYIDQKHDGGLVVMLTDVTANTVAEIEKRMPANSKGLQFEQVRYTRAELEQALAALRDAWAAETRVPVLTAGIDTMNNRLRVGVPHSFLVAANEALEAVTLKLGVPVHVRGEDPDSDTVCTNRDNCHTPLRPGVVVRNDGPNTGRTCTMGFLIVVNDTDEQFLTSGHCGCAYVPTDWHHQGLGLVGNEAATMTGLAQKKDIMRVQMNDSQASALIYADSGDMGDGALPVVNETIFASLGISNVKKTGTVTSDWTNWGSDKCGATMWGGDTNLTTIPGDSGSPIYRRFNFGGEWYITPIGVSATAGGAFGRVRDALDHWDATVVHP